MMVELLTLMVLTFGYVLVGTSASNRINENSEALYDPYINGSGNLNANDNKQQVSITKYGLRALSLLTSSSKLVFIKVYN